jgi:hypothetical protein
MEWIRRVSSTKYTRALEADVARLRAENRALLNSILGIAGVPPVVVADNDVSPATGLKPVALKPAAGSSGTRDWSDEKQRATKRLGHRSGAEGGADAAAVVAADLPVAGNEFGAKERGWRHYLTEATCHSSADDIMRMHWRGSRSKRRARPRWLRRR